MDHFHLTHVFASLGLAGMMTMYAAHQNFNNRPRIAGPANTDNVASSGPAPVATTGSAPAASTGVEQWIDEVGQGVLTRMRRFRDSARFCRLDASTVEESKPVPSAGAESTPAAKYIIPAKRASKLKPSKCAPAAPVALKSSESAPAAPAAASALAVQSEQPALERRASFSGRWLSPVGKRANDVFESVTGKAQREHRERLAQLEVAKCEQKRLEKQLELKKHEEERLKHEAQLTFERQESEIKRKHELVKIEREAAIEDDLAARKHERDVVDWERRQQEGKEALKALQEKHMQEEEAARQAAAEHFEGIEAEQHRVWSEFHREREEFQNQRGEFEDLQKQQEELAVAQRKVEELLARLESALAAQKTFRLERDQEGKSDSSLASKYLASIKHPSVSKQLPVPAPSSNPKFEPAPVASSTPEFPPASVSNKTKSVSKQPPAPAPSSTPQFEPGSAKKSVADQIELAKKMSKKSERAIKSWTARHKLDLD